MKPFPLWIQLKCEFGEMAREVQDKLIQYGTGINREGDVRMKGNRTDEGK